MRNELTYAVDQMARYNGAFGPAFDNVQEYYLAGGLSVDYFNRVVHYMNLINVAQLGTVVPKHVVKAMRKKMPRVHTEVSNWRLTYYDHLLGAFEARVIGHYTHAKLELRCARRIRERYL